MKASEANLLDFLRKSFQFVIPIYQRTYSWTSQECSQLWNDILRVGNHDTASAHFVGSIVYIEAGLYSVSSQSSLLVIDGQQRLTTVMLILEALARHMGDQDHIEGFSAAEIRQYYLLNTIAKGDRQYKLLLTQTDKDTLLSLFSQKPFPSEPSQRIKDNFQFFEKAIQKHNVDIDGLCKGLAKLTIVDISLSRGDDDPQLIFESMNSTGRELTQADLIRNYVLMGLDQEQQDRLYNDWWRPIELAFGQEAYSTTFDSFMRHYLTMKSGEIPKIRAVYEAFKRYYKRPDVVESGAERLVEDILTYAEYYCAMALDKETDKALAVVFRDLRELKVDVAFPLLLEMYHDYALGVLDKLEFLEAVRLVEAYVFRRAVCAIPTNSLNRTFATFRQALNKECYIHSIRYHFHDMPSYRRFPSDDEFKQKLKTRDLYSFPRRSYCLRRLENYGRKEHVMVEEYTIEHIMPHNENLSSEWRNALGARWRDIQIKHLHTLGNLTLSGYNSEYSDRSFTEKREMQGGFRESPLRLNDYVRDLNEWNEHAIETRASQLADIACRVWSRPASVTSDTDKSRGDRDAENSVRTLQTSDAVDDKDALTRRDETRVGTTRELTDPVEDAADSGERILARKLPIPRDLSRHHRVLNPENELFNVFLALRKELVALHVCVTEKVLEDKIAYRAETSFVDVVPRESWLCLFLNIRFYELHDPRGIAMDVGNVKGVGIGDAVVYLDKAEEVRYVMSLIRQAFECQLDDGVDGP